MSQPPVLNAQPAQSLLEALDAALLVLDPASGRVLWANLQARDLAGQALEGRGCGDLLTGTDGTALGCGPDPSLSADPVRGRLGRTPCLLSLRGLDWPGHGPARLVTAMPLPPDQDTPRPPAPDPAPASLDRADAFTARLLETSPAAIVVMNPQGRIIFANAQAETILGQPRSRLIGRQADGPSWKSADHRGDPMAPEDLPFQRALTEDRPVFDVGMSVQRPNGRRVYLSVNAAPLRSPEGAVEGVVAAFTDVSLRKLAETALRESEERFHSLFESMHEGLALHRIILDEDGQPADYVILDVNPGYVSILGIPRSRALGRLGSDLYNTSPAPYLDLYAHTALTGEPTQFDTYFPPLARHFTISVACPAPGQFATLFEDITARKADEEALRAAKAAAEEASRSKTVFLASMSHELRTPLSGIIGMLRLCLDPESESQRTELVSNALQAATGLLHILSDLLDLSRIEAGGLTLVREPFELNAVLSPVMATFQDQARGKGLNLVLDLDPATPPRMMGDGGRIRQILVNLVGNALRYTDQGSVRLEISPLPHRPGLPPLVQFGVVDTGQGIPEDKIGHVFHMFAQADETIARRHGGTGLGLAIVERLVRLMDGTLALSSGPGEGTEVRLALPLPPATPAGHPGHEDNPGRIRGLRVLVVEDERINRTAARILLTRSGCLAETAASGPDALQALAERPFDCVLMDIQMPGMDGTEATRRIREGLPGSPNPPDIPIIALTAFGMAGDREKFLSSGLDDYLVKPVGREELLAALTRATDRRTAPAPPGRRPG